MCILIRGANDLFAEILKTDSRYKFLKWREPAGNEPYSKISLTLNVGNVGMSMYWIF